jgi:hypothetical protein
MSQNMSLSDLVTQDDNEEVFINETYQQLSQSQKDMFDQTQRMGITSRSNTVEINLEDILKPVSNSTAITSSDEWFNFEKISDLIKYQNELNLGDKTITMLKTIYSILVKGDIYKTHPFINVKYHIPLNYQNLKNYFGRLFSKEGYQVIDEPVVKYLLQDDYIELDFQCCGSTSMLCLAEALNIPLSNFKELSSLVDNPSSYHDKLAKRINLYDEPTPPIKNTDIKQMINILLNNPSLNQRFNSLNPLAKEVQKLAMCFSDKVNPFGLKLNYDIILPMLSQSINENKKLDYYGNPIAQNTSLNQKVKKTNSVVGDTPDSYKLLNIACKGIEQIALKALSTYLAKLNISTMCNKFDALYCNLNQLNSYLASNKQQLDSFLQHISLNQVQKNSELNLNKFKVRAKHMDNVLYNQIQECIEQNVETCELPISKLSEFNPKSCFTDLVKELVAYQNEERRSLLDIKQFIMKNLSQSIVYIKGDNDYVITSDGLGRLSTLKLIGKSNNSNDELLNPKISFTNLCPKTNKKITKQLKLSTILAENSDCYLSYSKIVHELHTKVTENAFDMSPVDFIPINPLPNKLENHDFLANCIVKIIKESLCDNQIAEFNYVMSFLKRTIFERHIKLKTALVFVSEFGGGKGSLRKVLGCILGGMFKESDGIREFSDKHATPYKGKRLIFCDEVGNFACSSPTGKEAYERLKAAVTDNKISVRPLYHQSYTEDNRASIILSTNHETAIPSYINCRRFTFIKGTTNMNILSNEKFFKKEEMDLFDNEKSLYQISLSFMHYLNEFEPISLSKDSNDNIVNLNKPLMNSFKLELTGKLNTMLYFLINSNGDKVKSTNVLEHYDEFMTKIMPDTKKLFFRTTKEITALLNSLTQTYELLKASKYNNATVFSWKALTKENVKMLKTSTQIFDVNDVTTDGTDEEDDNYLLKYYHTATLTNNVEQNNNFTLGNC